MAASFRYDPDKTKEENWADARAFLMQVQRGDYFQMAANYYYGVGAARRATASATAMCNTMR